jgi:hypothetical protein
MNRLSRAIILLGGMAIVVMTLLPPWILTSTFGTTNSIKDAGYHFVFENPGRDARYTYRLLHPGRSPTEKDLERTSRENQIVELLRANKDDEAAAAFKKAVDEGILKEDDGKRLGTLADNPDTHENVSYTVNVPRLITQCVFVALFTLGLLWIAKGRPAKSQKDSGRKPE